MSLKTGEKMTIKEQLKRLENNQRILELTVEKLVRNTETIFKNLLLVSNQLNGILDVLDSSDITNQLDVMRKGIRWLCWRHFIEFDDVKAPEDDYIKDLLSEE